jgi:uncharacterized protein DUF6916
MPATLTEKEFSQHLNTKFRAHLEEGDVVDLELTQVKPYLKGAQEGMEQFSALFRGPTEPRLPQRIYSFKHDQMGEFEIFIVPIGLDDHGIRYEAVFNYFK